MNASQLFKQLYDNASKSLSLFQQTALTPHNKKELKEWGITDAASMIKRSPQQIRTLEDQNKIPKARTIMKGKREERIYSLKEINYLRDYFGTRNAKPQNAPAAIISVVNFKGGATKSTTAINLGQYFSLKGYKVLLIDGDSQGSTTQMFGYIPDKDVKPSQTLLEVLIGGSEDLSPLIENTHWDGIDLIRSNLSLFNAELIIPAQVAEHSSKTGQQLPFYARLHNALEKIQNQYDMVIFDAPPSLGMVTMNILYASNCVLIPMPPYVVDYASTVQFLNMVYETFDRLPNMSYAFVRILLSRYKNNSIPAKEIEDLTRQFLGQYIMSNYMIESEAVSKAASNLKTIYEMDPHRNEQRTYARAKEYFDRVGDELETLIKMMWDRSIKNPSHHSTSKVAEHV